MSAIPTSLSGRLVAGPSATTEIRGAVISVVVRSDEHAHARRGQEFDGGQVDDEPLWLVGDGGPQRFVELRCGYGVDHTGYSDDCHLADPMLGHVTRRSGRGSRVVGG